VRSRHQIKQLTGGTHQPFEDPDATFIRSITYRSSDGHRFDTISKQITDLKKEINKREQQKKEMADVVDQGSLVELKGRRPLKLPEVFVRPALDGKRLPGEVEIHQNGLRYQSPMGSQKIGRMRSMSLLLVLMPVYRRYVQQHQTSVLPAMRP
jgi:nucleosome binding factor SPN SPT16 subunit